MPYGTTSYAGGSGAAVVAAGAAPVADFTGTPLSGAPPLSVAFTDTSTNTPTSWAWDFGDGTTSTVQNPTKVYTRPGSYTVALTATNADGSDVETKVAYVGVRQTQFVGMMPLAVGA